MKKEICYCGHPKESHPEQSTGTLVGNTMVTEIIQPCRHCSCKEFEAFYAREELTGDSTSQQSVDTDTKEDKNFFGMSQEEFEKVMKKVIREANEE